MTTVPDGEEVVLDSEAAATLARPPLLVVEPVRAFLESVGLGGDRFAWQRIGDGQSNVTYAIDVDGRRMVLRRGPRPPLPRSAHDMPREARVLTALAAAGVAVPTVLAVCEDSSVIGVPFYVMDFLDGDVITDVLPEWAAPEDARRQIAEEAVDTLARLHQVDASTSPLNAIGRPEGYLSRQIDRFGGLWAINSQRSIPAVDQLGEWLRDNLPTTSRTSVVHGDYRIGNLQFRRGIPPAVSAIFDWEMATLGDPLADLGYLTATYAEVGADPTVMELTSVTRQSGFLSRRELVDRYREMLPIDTSSLAWYQALALWRAAIFCEALYTRWIDGQRPGDTFAPTLEGGVPELLAASAAFAELRIDLATTRVVG